MVSLAQHRQRMWPDMSENEPQVIGLYVADPHAEFLRIDMQCKTLVLDVPKSRIARAIWRFMGVTITRKEWPNVRDRDSVRGSDTK